MLFPDYNEFSRLARTATLVPVAKTVAADLRTPVSAFLSVAAEEPNAFLLESVEGGEKIGRYTFLGARPYMVLARAAARSPLNATAKSRTRKATFSRSLTAFCASILRRSSRTAAVYRGRCRLLCP